jgi:uncharacterized protein YjbI with pentapeptide repeats
MSEAYDYRLGDDNGAEVGIGDTPVNPYTLLGAVNETSELCHTGWLIFLGVVAYFCIAVAGVTHKDLLLNSAVQLPVMQVSIDLTRFFLFAPILLVFLHFGLLVQHVMLARKVLEFDAAVRPLEASARRSHPLRLELHSYYFTQQLAGPDRSPLLGGFLHGMFWLSVFGLPIVIILYIQLVFLPYHDVTTTWAHRIALLADAALLMLIGVFLGSRSASFLRAFGRSARFQPISFLMTAILLIGVVFFSLFIATIPDEGMDKLARSLPGARVEVQADASGLGGRTVFGMTEWFFDSQGGRGGLQTIFRRNLVVTDENVTGGGDNQNGNARDRNAAQNLKDGARISLRGRDLRYAILDRSILQNVDLTNADLAGASLIRTDLTGARMSCADIDAVLKKTRSRTEACTKLAGVLLTGAQLAQADLRGAFLTGAKLDNTNLDGADLRFTELIDTDFSGASMRRAILSGGTNMIGANFLGAQLQGADLTGAKMHGADFSGAGLQGAQLSFAQAYGANFQSAEMDGAVLNAAKLQGADFTGAVLTGIDANAALVWLTRVPPPDKVAIADLSQLKVQAMATPELNALQATLEAVALPRLRSRLERALERILDRGFGSGWETSPEGKAWIELKARSAAVEPSVYRAQLSEYLSQTACEARFSDGAVAAGLIRRVLSPSFKGNVAILHGRLTGATCPAGRKITEDQMNRLAAAAELAGQTATASVIPDGTLAPAP